MSEFVVACALLALAGAVLALVLAVRLLARFTAVVDAEAYLKQDQLQVQDPITAINAFNLQMQFPVVP